MSYSSVESRSLDQIKAVLANALEGKPCAVYLFGSRAAGTHSPVSDFDIGVWSAQDISRELSAAREKLELSNIPFKVDLVDLHATSATFGSKVQTEGILLWKN